jgi:hypothetical protein
VPEPPTEIHRPENASQGDGLSLADLSVEDGKLVDQACVDYENALIEELDTTGLPLSPDPFLGAVPERLRPVLRRELRRVADEWWPCVPGYETQRFLGKGGMGRVYLARRLKLNQLVALKVIRERWGGTETAARTRHEAEVMARLNDPHIVQIYDIAEHNGRPCLVLEFVPGESLTDRLKRGPILPDQAARLMETLARAAHHFHQHDIVHRDLKPANILLGGDPSLPLAQLMPKISDFGLARALDASHGRTRSGAIIGTPEYMAPEQARGDSGQVDCRTDVYALGAILYECLTGRPPFPAAKGMDTLLQVCTEEPVLPRRYDPNVDRGLEFICLKCLEKDPKHRYQSAEELAADLGRESPIPLSLGEWLWRQVTKRGRIEDAGLWSRLLVVMAAWTLLGHAVFFLLLQIGPAVGVYWAWLLAFHAGFWLVLWPLLRPRLRLAALERGILFDLVAVVFADAILLALFCPPWDRPGPCRERLPGLAGGSRPDAGDGSASFLGLLLPARPGALGNGPAAAVGRHIRPAPVRAGQRRRPGWSGPRSSPPRRADGAAILSSLGPIPRFVASQERRSPGIPTTGKEAIHESADVAPAGHLPRPPSGASGRTGEERTPENLSPFQERTHLRRQGGAPR